MVDFINIVYGLSIYNMNVSNVSGRKRCALTSFSTNKSQQNYMFHEDIINDCPVVDKQY